jgi:hypothetical protein
MPSAARSQSRSRPYRSRPRPYHTQNRYSFRASDSIRETRMTSPTNPPSAAARICDSLRRSSSGLFATLLLTTVLQAIPAAAGKPARDAHATRTLDVTDTAHVHFVSETQSGDLVEEGQAKGALPGTVKVTLSLSATINATFIIKTPYGSLSGRGSGAIGGSGHEASFGGSMTVTRGTGRYAHARGHGGFYGTIDRENTHDPAVVQTTGSLTY